MSSVIVVPARYGSTRFPGKPLALLGGESLLARTARNAQLAAAQIEDAVAIVATDDDRIFDHCTALNMECVMTPSELPSGSDRALHAANIYKNKYGKAFDIIVNLQGDAPFTPPEHVKSVILALKSNSNLDVATPYIKLSWSDLDQFRDYKTTTPFSGTTVVTKHNGEALWFSKNIIPAIRNEAILRYESDLSPVCRHIGLYAYRTPALEKFVSLPEGHWEKLEGLEQLRCLENDMAIGCVEVEPADIAISGIDTPEDLARAENLLAKANIR